MTQESKNDWEAGRVVATCGAADGLDPEDVHQALGRHFARDWGECTPEDWQANDEALLAGWRVLSVHRDRQGAKFWILTEADRSVTTVLLPEEY